MACRTILRSSSILTPLSISAFVPWQSTVFPQQPLLESLVARETGSVSAGVA